jgi:hypothetical protein
MATKLKILLTLLILSLATFSQNATGNKLHCFPDSTAKKIAIDLVKGDSAKAELTRTKQLVSLLEEKNATNERLIMSYVTKVSNYTTQIDLYKKKESEYNKIVIGLEKDALKIKKANKYFKISVGVLSVTTIVGFLLK